jgi:type IV fimbrial biogenesis protein FimT
VLGPLTRARRGAPAPRRAVTLIEISVVLLVLGVLATLATPSMTRMIELQRLRSINSELVTDLQFARTEAISRNVPTTVKFSQNSAVTCYMVFRGSNTSSCDCTNGSGSACTGTAVGREIRTVQIARSTGITLAKVGTTLPNQFEYDPLTGGIRGISSDGSSMIPLTYALDLKGSAAERGWLRTVVSQAGRPSVCSKDGANPAVVACE